MRNKEMTILRALGIIFVVMGHKYDPFTWFPAYSFHMALFFFVSGYFYKEIYEINVMLYIKKKIKKTIPVYFAFNLFYMIVTFLIYKKYNFQLGSLPNLKTFFITPFINGHQYHLFLAAWFMLALLIIQIVFILIYTNIKKLNNNIHISFFIFFVIGISGTYMAKYVETNETLKLVLIRTCFGLFFYYLGFYFKKNENKNVINSLGVLLVLIVQVVILMKFKNIQYELVWGNFNGHILLPFLTSSTAIYLYLFLSKALSKILKDDDILYKIGDHTLSVMVNHLFIFFIINYIILKLTHGDLMELQNIWFSYKLELYWPIYVILGVLGPVYLAEFYDKFRYIINNNTKFK